MTTSLWVEPQLGTISGGLRYNQQVRAALQAIGAPTQALSLPRSAFEGAAGRAAIERAAQQLQPDVVVLDGLIGSAHPELFGTPDDEPAAADALLVHLPVAAWLEAEGWADPQAVQRERQAVGSAGHVVTVSRWSAGQLRRRYRRGDAHIAIPGAEVPDALPPRGQRAETTFACVAGLNQLKNHRLLIEALQGLQHFSWRLVLAGPGADTDYGAQLLTECADRLPGRVDYRGVLTPQEVLALWVQTDLLLLPSLVETYGMVVTEACAHGVPAFVTAGTGAQEALGGAGAALALDSAEWSAALQRFLTDGGFRSQLHRRAWRRRNSLPSWKSTAEVFAQLR